METDPWAAREAGIKAYHENLSQSALDKYNKPKEAWKNVVAGHQKAVAGSLTADEEKQFKQDRRDWNRLYKSTPVGIMASGVNLDDDPFGAQTLYHDMSAHLGHDAPKLMDRMYPISRGAGKIFSAAIENIGPLSWLKKILPKREPKVPANVLAMRDRFPGINEITPEGADKIIPPYGIAPLIPEHIRNSTLNKLMSEDEGIFYGGRGELSPDFDYEELRMRKPFDYDLAELMEEIMAGEVETEEDTKELSEDKKAELEALLLSPEFQALSQYEKEERLKEYGIDDLTPDLLEVQ